METDWKDILSRMKTEREESDNCISDSSMQHNPEEDKHKQIAPLTIILDKKGRKGKIATIIEGFTIPQEEVENIARAIKNRIGVGGSTREGEILLQGDQKQKVVEFLKTCNYKFK